MRLNSGGRLLLRERPATTFGVSEFKRCIVLVYRIYRYVEILYIYIYTHI